MSTESTKEEKIDFNVTLVPGSYSDDPVKAIWFMWEQSRCDDSASIMEQRYNKLLLHGHSMDASDHYKSVAKKTMEDVGFPCPVDAMDPRERFKLLLQMDVPILETIKYTFMLENIPVSFREQLVRHRVGSKIGPNSGVDDEPGIPEVTYWSQTSRVRDLQNFVEKENFFTPKLDGDTPKLITVGEDSPLTVDDNWRYTDKEIFLAGMRSAQWAYRELRARGYAPEIAREILPSCTTHRITWTVNLKSLKHIFGHRTCFTGDTKVALLDGRSLSMKEIHEEYGTDKPLWVYAYDHTKKKITPGLAWSSGVRKVVNEVFEVTIDNGITERCSGDHEWMLRDGTYRRADELQAGDSLMPLYRRVSDGSDTHNRVGYEELHQPDGEWEFTHRIVAKDILDRKPGQSVVHHSSFDKRNNSPDHVEWTTWADHFKLHRANGSASMKRLWTSAEFREKKTIQNRLNGKISGPDNLIDYNQNPKTRLKKSISLKERWKDPKSRKILIEACHKQDHTNFLNSRYLRTFYKGHPCPPHMKAAFGERIKKAWANPEHRARMSEAVSKSNYIRGLDDRKLDPNYDPRIEEFYSMRTEELKNVATTKSIDPSLPRGKIIHKLYKQATVHNHKVLSVKKVSVDSEELYDLQVMEHHNFALASGAFVSNCWIALSGYWHPIIHGVIRELTTKVSKVFSSIANPPCIEKKTNKFKACVFEHENKHRMPGGNDPGIPCALWLGTQEPVAGVTRLQLWSNAASTDENAEMLRMMAEYGSFWHRDVVTGNPIL